MSHATLPLQQTQPLATATSHLRCDRCPNQISMCGLPRPATTTGHDTCFDGCGCTPCPTCVSLVDAPCPGCGTGPLG